MSFLYIVAALLKARAFGILHEVFTSNYLLPEAESYERDSRFVGFTMFFASSRTLGQVLAPAGQRLLSPVAALLKRQANRTDLPFESIMEAELLSFILAAIKEPLRWYPQTLLCAGHSSSFPFFLRSTQQKHFKNLSIVTGIQTADDLRAKVKVGMIRMQVDQWTDFTFYASVSLWKLANMDKLATIK